MKVFHLTYWYPNRSNPSEAVWIRRHIDSLAPYVQQQFTFHFEVKKSERFFLETSSLHSQHSSIRIAGPIPWRLIEGVCFIGLALILLIRARKYNVVNVHIGYPLLTYFHLIKKLFKKPVIIIEHWSAYHYGFGIKKALPRIQRIFNNGLPLVTVSEALLRDVEKFSAQAVARYCIVPNAVDSNIFHRSSVSRYEPAAFFMLSHWKWPKRADIVLRAFSQLIQLNECSRFRLRIGGSGPQLPEMQRLISSLQINDYVVILGDLNPVCVATEMRRSAAFIHCSEYETFSVVCAEAISC